MSLSNIALALARRLPAPTRLLLRAWAERELRDPDQAHWLFMELKDRVGLRLEREARLFDGQRLIVDPFDSVGSAIFVAGCYEPETVRVFETLLRPGSVVVDAGAHVGQYSLIAARAVGPAGRVHAFEPDPETFVLLERNLGGNPAGNARANPTALGERAGLAKLHLAASGNVGGNSLARTDCSTGLAIEVPVETLDHYLGDAPGADLIKADVEGAELPFLRGAQSVLAAAHPHLILELSVHTESFGYARADLVVWLHERGYLIYRIGALPLKALESPGAGPDWYNCLAVHRSRIDEPAVRSLISMDGQPPGGFEG